MYTPELNEREWTIVYGLADGDTVAEIASGLNYSPETIKGHLRRVYQKLGAKNAAHAVALAYHYGILTPKQPVDASAP